VDASLAGRLGELLLVGFRGTDVEDNEEVRHLVCDLKVGGVILYERANIQSPEQVARLTGRLQALAVGCAGRPLLIAADNEGGSVMRLSTRVGYEPTFSHRELGDQGDLALTELEARRIGRMLREAGINWNLAPVVDLALNPLNPVIVRHGRAFSVNPDNVTAHARAYLEGMRAAGVLTTVKHFPGHGSSRKDSHDGFVDVSKTANLELELRPYRELIGRGLVDSVMTAHVFNRRLDRRYPATLSRATIDGLLRAKLGFQGLVVADDLLMGAIVKRFGIEEAALRALSAGVDVLLISEARLRNGRAPPDRILAALTAALARGKLSRPAVEAALERIARFRQRLTHSGADHSRGAPE
jgi:beta-N-acetylhexosaminidase